MPMVLPAPGRFSTMIGCPSWADTWSITTRPMTSVALPGVSGTIRRIGLDGQACADCAQAGADASRERAGAASAAAVRLRNWRRVGFAVIIPSRLPVGPLGPLLGCVIRESQTRPAASAPGRRTLLYPDFIGHFYRVTRALGMI